VVSVDLEGDEEDFEATVENTKSVRSSLSKAVICSYLRIRKAILKRTTSHPSTRARRPLGAERAARPVVLSIAATLPAGYDLDADADA
jgi:hypothetical protein